jgi:uncharacterized protein with PQ loop repeat
MGFVLDTIPHATVVTSLSSETNTVSTAHLYSKIPPIFSSNQTTIPPARPVPPPPYRRLDKHTIGRISAWTCTTLYLTSRLPQIWKNYTRKSVEGLAISLFVCAFLGNFFYVASMLTAPILKEPPPISTRYIHESIPYLLGSGGTLVFDITIVCQAFLYKGRSPLRSSSHKRRRTTASTHHNAVVGAGADVGMMGSQVLVNDEEAALLAGDEHAQEWHRGYGTSSVTSLGPPASMSGSQELPHTAPPTTTITTRDR